MTNVTVVPNTAMADRREKAADHRGLPASFSRALEALKGPCARCTQRAVISSGAGVGVCERHRRERLDRVNADIRTRERLRQRIEAAKREL